MHPIQVRRLLLALALLAVPGVTYRANAGKAHAAAPAARAAAASGEWPATEMGALAKRWVEAFSSGERAMRQALPQVLSAESLSRRGMDARMETYRALHERLGGLMLASVDSVGPDGLQVTLAASDFSTHVFTFTAEPGRPRRLGQVMMTDHVQSHGFFHH